MFPKTGTLAVLAALAITFAVKSSAQMTSAAGVIPDDVIARSEWLKAIEQSRSSQISLLLATLGQRKGQRNEDQAQSALWYSVRALSTLRAEESIGPLMDLIDTDFSEIVEAITPPHDSEVIKALSRIGTKASRAAVAKLADDKSSKRAIAYLRVIYLVEGPEVGKFVLELAARDEKDPDKKVRLEKAIELFVNADKVVP